MHLCWFSNTLASRIPDKQKSFAPIKNVETTVDTAVIDKQTQAVNRVKAVTVGSSFCVNEAVCQTVAVNVEM
ncbi:unnamed protein product [Arctogadus glacialis]